MKNISFYIKYVLIVCQYTYYTNSYKLSYPHIVFADVPTKSFHSYIDDKI